MDRNPPSLLMPIDIAFTDLITQSYYESSDEGELLSTNYVNVRTKEVAEKNIGSLLTFGVISVVRRTIADYVAIYFSRLLLCPETRFQAGKALSQRAPESC